MSKMNRLKEWLETYSFRELTLTLEVIVCTWILYFYLERVFSASAVQLADSSWLSGLLVKVILFSIGLSIASHIVLAIVGDGELDKDLDVREKQIELVGYKYSAIILQVGISIAIVQYAIEAQQWVSLVNYIPYLPLHIMVTFFILADLGNYIAQLYKGRTGDIYD